MGRSRVAWLIILTWLAAAGAGCGKSAPNPPGSNGAPVPQAAPQNALALRAPEGTHISYRTVVSTAFAGKGLNGPAVPAGAPLDGKTTMEYDADLTFEKVAGNEATVAYTLSGFKSATQVGGTQLPDTAGAIGEMRFTMKMDTRTGKLLETDLGAGFSDLIDEADMRQTLEQTFAQYPTDGSAKPGGSWTTDMPFSLPGIADNSKVKITTTYAADETRDGARVAKLVTKGGGPISLTGESDGVTFTLTGTIELTGTQFVDLATGLPWSVESRSHFAFTQSMKDAQSGQGIDTEMKTTVEISMHRK